MALNALQCALEARGDSHQVIPLHNTPCNILTLGKDAITEAIKQHYVKEAEVCQRMPVASLKVYSD